MATVKIVAINMNVQISLQNTDCIPFGYILGRGIAGSYGSSVLNFCRKLHTVFRNCCSNLYSHQYVQVFSTSLPTTVIIWYLIIAIPPRIRYFHCGFDLNFLDDYWCWRFFHILVGHFYDFFGKISIYHLCPFFKWVIYLFAID